MWRILSAVMLFMAADIIAAERWSDPEVFRVNKEPAHAEFVVYDNRWEAKQPFDPANPWSGNSYMSLNGAWEFNWYPHPGAVPEGWFRNNTDVREWDQIQVPGCWQTYGYDRLYYLNSTLPFWFKYDDKGGERREGFTDGEALIASAVAGYVPADSVSVGCYRKQVELTKKQLEGRTVLRIGAVEAGVPEYLDYWLSHRSFQLVRRYMAHGARHLDGTARKEHGKPFAGCTGEQQDAILKTFSDGDFKAGKFDGSVFFQQLMELTLEGYLSDPKYGGNRNRVGWRLVGIPDGLRSCWWNPHGVEMVLSPDEGFQD